MSENSKSLNILIEKSIKQNWENLALTDFNGSSFQHQFGWQYRRQETRHNGQLHFFRR